MNARNHTPDGSALIKLDWIAAAGLALVLLICGASRLVPGVTGTYHDDAIYVSTAKSLADGEGYRLINLPGAPPQTKYPFLYPLVLAAIWKLWPVFPQNVIVMQWMTLLLACAAIGLGYLYLIRFSYCGRSVALGVGLICATSPDITYFSTVTMAEMPFALLTVVALWLLEVAMAKPLSAGRALMTGAVLAAPFLCREVGVSIAVGAIGVLALTRRRFFWTGVGATMTAAPWVVWSVRAWGVFKHDPISGFYTDYLGDLSTSISADFIHVLSSNFAFLLADTITNSFSGFVTLLTEMGIPATAVVLALGLLTWSAVALDAARFRLLPSCLIAYALVITVWPWPPTRFVIPLLPLILAYLVIGLRNSIGRLFSRQTATWLAITACAIAIIANLVLIDRVIVTTQRYAYPAIRPAGVDSSWASFEELFQWLRTHSEEHEVLAAGLDTMCFLYTNRRAIRPFPHRPDALFYGGNEPPTGTPAQLLMLLRKHRVRYLIETPMPMFREERFFGALVRETQSRYPAFLTQVYRGADPRFAVYTVR